MDSLNPELTSHPLEAIYRSVEALANLLFLMRTARRESQDPELYLDLAEKELERLKSMIRQP